MISYCIICCFKGKVEFFQKFGGVVLNNAGSSFEVCLDPASQCLDLFSFHF